MVQHHVPADAEQESLAEDADHDRGRSVDRVDATGVEIGVAVGTDDVAVVHDVAALAVVRGHDPDAVERLGQVGQHVRDAVTTQQVALLRGVVEPDRKDEQERNDEQHRPRRERDVRDEQDDRDDDHGETLHRELADAVLDQLLEVLDVARHAAHQDAGLLLGEEVEAEPLEVREDADPQVVHHPRGEFSRDVDLASLQEGARDADDQVERRADRHDVQRVVAAAHAVVDRELGEEWSGLQDQTDHDHEHRPEYQVTGVGHDEARQRESLTLLLTGALGEGAT